MANETVVKVGADASGYTAELEKARKSANAFINTQSDMAKRTALAQSAIAEATANGSDASASAVKSFTDALLKNASTAGKSRAEILAMRAANLGLSDSVKPYIEQIAKASEHTHSFSLESSAAKRELLVLGHELSQGNYKQFAGSLLVMAEVTGAFNLILHPVTIGLGAMAAAAYVAYEAIHSLSEEHEKLNQTMVLTNNYSNLTQGALLSYSDTISRDLGVSTANAKESLLAMASSGLVAGADLRDVSESVAAYAKLSGQSIEDVAKMFVQSYGSAGDAAKKWADTHHDLTQAQIENIRVIEQSGDKAGAWKSFVTDASAAARKAVVADNKSMAESYESLSDAWSRFWRGLVGKSDDLTKISDRIAQLRSLENSPDSNPGGTQTAAYEAEISQLEARREQLLSTKQLTDDNSKALSTFDSINQKHIEDMKSTWTWQQKLNDANKTAKDRTDALIDAARAAGKLTPQLQAQLQSDLQKTYAYNATQFHAPHQSNRGYVESKGDSLLDDAQKANAALKEQIANGERMTTWAAKYAGLQATIDGYEGKTLTKAQESIKAHQAVLLPLYAQNAALEQQFTDAENAKKLNIDRISLNDKLWSQNDALAAQHKIELDSVNMTNEQRERAVKLLEIETQRQKELADWSKTVRDRKQEGTETDTSERANINSIYDARRDEQIKTFQQQDINKGDWMGGASRGLTEIIDKTSNLRDIATSTATSAVDTLGDSIARLATTGKLNFGDLTRSIVADFIKIESEALIARAAMSFLNSMGWGGASTAVGSGVAAAAHLASGGAVSGPGTSTSDSIPAMLSDGEYVLRASAAKRIGVSNLDAMNNGASVHGLARFASGGAVGRVPDAGAASGSTQFNITMPAPSNDSAPQYTQGQIADLQRLLKGWVDQQITRSYQQGGAGWNQRVNRV